MVKQKVAFLILLSLFLWIFGYPAFKKYRDKGIFIEHAEIYSKEVIPPAITVSPRNPNTGFGWKKNFVPKYGKNWVKEGPCANSSNAIELLNCIEDNTFTIKEAFGYERINTSAWKREIMTLQAGNCFKKKVPKGTMGFSPDKSLFLPLTSNLDYYFSETKTRIDPLPGGVISIVYFVDQ